ncbi:hypothetical protein JS82_07695 [Methanomassiliicoccaceae archaeon DOK]|nr:hypothetical protein JS82_07695 [Methanomassiliicoccaceae archaeon DOK]
MRNATPTQTGFHFQDCAGVVLFFDYIKDVDSLRIEGSEEDIALFLDDGSKILSQAKYCDLDLQSKYAIRDLKKALSTLSESDSTDCRRLIYATNIIFPLGEKSVINFGSQDRTIHYSELTEDGKNYIDEIIENNKLSLNPEKLSFRIISFYGIDSRSRYEVMYRSLNRFLSKLGNNRIFDDEKILSLILSIIVNNKTERDLSVTISKNDIVWIVVEQVLSDICSELDTLDEATRFEVESMYHEIISIHQERIDFASRVHYDFAKWRRDLPRTDETIRQFITLQWNQYADEFDNCGIDPEIKTTLISIILSKILGLRYLLPKIKEASGIVDKRDTSY